MARRRTSLGLPAAEHKGRARLYLENMRKAEKRLRGTLSCAVALDAYGAWKGAKAAAHESLWGAAKGEKRERPRRFFLAADRKQADLRAAVLRACRRGS